MSDTNYRAIRATKRSDGSITRELEICNMDMLPDHDVTICVVYSSLNYKDALSATGNPGVTRKFPHTPGIDAAGTVVESRDSRFKSGDSVLVTGFDLGMNTPGGFGEFIRVPGEWVVRKPDNLTLRETMMFGTAGFTAARMVDSLVRYGVEPGSGNVLVTGASGGVGSLAVAILSTAGYQVTAATGKSEAHEYLKSLGAAEVLNRDDIADTPDRMLLKTRWAGAVDTVGGEYLAAAIKSVHPRGVVTCCGLTASPSLKLTVMPFILRGVSLVGVDSAETPAEDRPGLWAKLAGEWKPDVLESITRTCGLEELEPYIERILNGRIQGRIVVDLR